jgi:hypothetical protein
MSVAFRTRNDFFVSADIALTQHIMRNPPPSTRARFCHLPIRSMSSAGRRDSLAHRNDQRDAHGHACSAHRWRQEENSLWCGSAVLNECSADSRARSRVSILHRPPCPPCLPPSFQISCLRTTVPCVVFLPTARPRSPLRISPHANSRGCLRPAAAVGARARL